MTVEEFVSGQFTKYVNVNNDGNCIIPKEDAHPEFKEIFDKAQYLVHYTSLITKQQLMLLDIQGSRYSLYDPEIATADLIDEGEVFFVVEICLLQVLTGSIMTTYAISIVTWYKRFLTVNELRLNVMLHLKLGKYQLH